MKWPGRRERRRPEHTPDEEARLVLAQVEGRQDHVDRTVEEVRGADLDSFRARYEQALKGTN